MPDNSAARNSSLGRWRLRASSSTPTAARTCAATSRYRQALQPGSQHPGSIGRARLGRSRGFLRAAPRPPARRTRLRRVRRRTSTARDVRPKPPTEAMQVAHELLQRSPAESAAASRPRYPTRLLASSGRRSPARVAAIGYCFGGMVVLELAQQRRGCRGRGRIPRRPEQSPTPGDADAN